jgi:hypothetical protein
MKPSQRREYLINIGHDETWSTARMRWSWQRLPAATRSDLRAEMRQNPPAVAPRRPGRPPRAPRPQRATHETAYVGGVKINLVRNPSGTISPTRTWAKNDRFGKRAILEGAGQDIRYARYRRFDSIPTAKARREIREYMRTL